MRGALATTQTRKGSPKSVLPHHAEPERKEGKHKAGKSYGERDNTHGQRPLARVFGRVGTAFHAARISVKAYLRDFRAAGDTIGVHKGQMFHEFGRPPNNLDRA
jgi:hypothetical protein